MQEAQLSNPSSFYATGLAHTMLPAQLIECLLTGESTMCLISISTVKCALKERKKLVFSWLKKAC
ncbi:hypothetical protein N7516_006319 [Penicillium verrucosum]|uniref:uncharacterized protein n=1 Tax=Penicillium verrucosum TaxID=60171 RepID=UPI002545B487|nr:uncharacterized protein N7516_006319 [Penicillium verrucosum]KAJ5931830.1 hypothetical protein N7516_006319 [Penicillium verrucosum]